MTKEKKLATLTPEEDKIWVNYFGFYLDAGYTDDSACNLAWRESGEGVSPAEEVRRSQAMTDKEILDSIIAWCDDEDQGYSDLIDVVGKIEQEMKTRTSEFPTVLTATEVAT